MRHITETAAHQRVPSTLDVIQLRAHTAAAAAATTTSATN